MQIEVGKFYRRRDGKKAGPMLVGSNTAYYAESDEYREYHADGRHYWRIPGCDLVAEWTDEPNGPVRTVTRKEIITGTYGKVMVGAPDNEWLPARIALDGAFNATELREVIATLTEIADALGEAE